jgi:hypothetical protein
MIFNEIDMNMPGLEAVFEVSSTAIVKQYFYRAISSLRLN